MKVMINIPESVYKWVKTQWEPFSGVNNIHTQVFDSVYNGVVLPSNPTNGDMIKFLYPNTESKLDPNTGITIVKWNDGTTKCFKSDWWDSPYKTEDKENE